jgi:hypothetical protein
MRRYLAALILLVVALPAVAQPPYYARGTFGDPANDPVNHTDPWNDLTHQMVDQGGGHYTATIGGPQYFPNVPFDYKLANADYSTQAPISGDGHVVTDNNGEVNFHLWTNNGNPWTDGWYPNNGPRAGYQDPGQFGWEINGTFNNWLPTADPTFALTTIPGSGLYTGTFTMQAGTYQYKFRQQGSFDTSVGADFNNHAANNSFRVWDNGEQWTFKLDLPNGRWQATSNTPTPDLNGDGYVNAADYVLLRKSNGSAAQYAEWRKHFGDVPPPPAFFARGSFNGFDQSIPMTDQGQGAFAATVSGLTPGALYTFKLANFDYSQQSPTSDGRVAADGSGQIHYHLFDQTSWTDGWFPNDERRAGYDDPQQYNWEVEGEFNGYAGDATWHMTDAGNGLYTLVKSLAAGNYQFKFRKIDDWGVSIGRDFGNSAANATTGTLAAGNYEFELDLPNGRWRVIPAGGSGSLTGSTVPEPATRALAMFGLTLLGAVRRRKLI